MIVFCLKPRNGSVAEQGRGNRSPVSWDIAFPIGLCSSSSSSVYVYAVRTKEQNGSVSCSSSRQKAQSPETAITCNKTLKCYNVTYAAAEMNSICCCLDLTISTKAENYCILET